MPIQAIIKEIGLSIVRCVPVSGGDVNEAYCLHGKDATYFLKINDAASYPKMFEREQEGLQELVRPHGVKIPTVIQSGTVDETQYLLMEWIERGNPAKNFWQHFGACLAMQHKQVQPYFGWYKDNYIGSLAQQNTEHSSWGLFYAACRIMPLAMQLYESGSFSKQDLLQAEQCCEKLPEFFPTEPPSLLHGDLWNGNYMMAENGLAAIFDPAVYYGHREMDIGMTKLFGGFNQQFYDAYNDVYPLDNNWQQRLPLTQLYPLLVHAILFGGHYINSVRAILRQFSS